MAPENKDYLKKLSAVKNAIAKDSELFDKDLMYEFDSIISDLNKNIQISLNKSRMLTIGIVGAVKAGKSSFLNALLFDGEDCLPKAATPMTAALTKISYSEEPKAVIHFYSKDDWKQIEEYASEYDEALQREYNDYIACFNEQNARSIKSGVSAKKSVSIQEYEKNIFIKQVSERSKSAKEMTVMAENMSCLEKLGKADTITGTDIISRLDDYVGVDGKFTAVVNYVEMQINNKALEGIEIIDTPGLNDPVVSRGRVTQRFLSECDAVILLSPSTQFMDSNTIRLMASSLPSEGVREILVVGSKLDSGILDSNSPDFNRAAASSIHNYRTHFENNLQQLKKNCVNNNIISTMDNSKVLFVSSLLYSAAVKKSRNSSLNDEEQHILDQLKSRFNDFDDSAEKLKIFSGFSSIKKAFKEIIRHKEEIISDKTSQLAFTAQQKALIVLETIQQDAIASRSKLENESLDDLEKRYNAIRSAIDSSRKKITSYFETAAIECEKNARVIESNIISYMGNYTKLYVQTHTSSSVEKHSTGFLGLKKEIVTTTRTDYSADTSDAVINIQNYYGKCNSIVHENFNLIMNKDKLCSRIKEIVIDTFSKGGGDYDEDDILIPLETVISRIQLPDISVSCSGFIDMINSQFPYRYAENEEIHMLRYVQTEALTGIKDEFAEQIKKSVKDITVTLNTQAVTFADTISNKISDETNRLKRQIAEKQKYITAYSEFITTLKEHKNTLLN